jgi:antitoxin component HigA of HigAB toxin-antitoxin module
MSVRPYTITRAREFKHVVKFMNSLFDIVGDVEEYEWAGLLDVVGQSVVSDILNERRNINARQVKALGARFEVSGAVFCSCRLSL